MKLALVHDWLNTLGGAERVLIELHKILPDAPIYTLFYDKKFKARYLPEAEIRPSFLQKFPFINKHYKYAAVLMPSAVESFDLSGFDVVISSSVFFSKGLVLRPKTRHICYCYSPTRQLWDLSSTNNQQPTTNNLPAKLTQHLLRLWDRQAADRVDEFVAISEAVRSRIQKYYHRDSNVIYPPVTMEYEIHNRDQNKKIFHIPNSILHNYYLIVSRLYHHKNIDIAIEAFSKLNLPLIIIGDGPDKKHLLRYCATLKCKNIKFLGFVPDEELPYYYQNCRAFIMSQEEDFGLTPIEAMQFGVPTLALRKGGALETLQESVTGEFFDDPIPEALADGVRRLNENYRNYRPDVTKSCAKKFSVERFRKEILDIVKH